MTGNALHLLVTLVTHYMVNKVQLSWQATNTTNIEEDKEVKREAEREREGRGVKEGCVVLLSFQLTHREARLGGVKIGG